MSVELLAVYDVRCDECNEPLALIPLLPEGVRSQAESKRWLHRPRVSTDVDETYPRGRWWCSGCRPDVAELREKIDADSITAGESVRFSLHTSDPGWSAGGVALAGTGDANSNKPNPVRYQWAPTTAGTVTYTAIVSDPAFISHIDT